MLSVLDDEIDPDPATVILTCANCGAAMDERKCKFICSCRSPICTLDSY